MTWSIDIRGHSNNSDGNAKEAEIVKAKFAEVVQELRAADLLVTTGKAVTNHGEVSLADVPE